MTTSKSRRLLIVVNGAPFFLSHRLPVARAAQEAGWDVHVATPEGAAVAAVREAGFTHHVIPMSRSGTHPLREIRTVFALWALYTRLAPTIAHLVTVKPVLYGGIVARVAGVPGVVSAVAGLGYSFTAQGVLGRLLRRFVLVAYRLALRHPNSRVLLQNPDDQLALESAGVLREDQAVMIRGSGVELDRFRPQGLPDGPPVVLLAARMLREKGVVEFVDAARKLRRRGVNARFVLAGDLDLEHPSGIDEATIRAWCEEHVVEWWGHQHDMPRVFAASHVVVLPSYYGEGLPKVLIEAAACGRPVITTDRPGCREAVCDGDTGLLVPARDPGALAAAIERLVANPSERARMGGQARKLAEAEFSVEEVVRCHLDVYDALSQGASELAGAESK